MKRLSRRDFVRLSMMGVGGTVVSSSIGLTGCSGDDDNDAPLTAGIFEHGVASGDPLSDSVIIWTRLSVTDAAAPARVAWEVATDDGFNEVINRGSASTDAGRDFTLKVDVSGLAPGSRYYYRFLSDDNTSAVGSTKTLPEGSVDQVRFVVMSCSNYPAGFFHVYREMAALENVDAALHLGDYIYEYARGEYASEDAAALGREVEPATEILTVDDYRARYAQYRRDPDLQALHRVMPMIAVWDDHEVANDTWQLGAENHDDDTEGEFAERLLAALTAYAEWMPIRPAVESNVGSLYRSFRFGDLVDLIMLDTRLVGRDRQLDFPSAYLTEMGLDLVTYQSDLQAESRTLLGESQRDWLLNRLESDTTWHVLGQQVLMGRMRLPGAIVTGQLSVAAYAELAGRFQVDPGSLTEEELQLLRLPELPYNPDAWDGYGYERDVILDTAFATEKNLVVLAGDTHNAWANNLTVETSEGMDIAGVEFATPSVSSPGAEDFLGLETTEAVLQTEAGLTQLFRDLQYTNLSDRGYLSVTFTATEVSANWTFVSTVKDAVYDILNERNREIVVSVNDLRING